MKNKNILAIIWIFLMAVFFIAITSEAQEQKEKNESFLEYQKLLVKISEINSVENDIERLRLNLETLETAKALLKRGSSSRPLLPKVDEKIKALKTAHKSLETKKEQLENSLVESKFSKYEGFGGDLDSELFLLTRRLLRLKAQVELTVRYEYDPYDMSAPKTKEIYNKIEKLREIYRKALDMGLKIEGMRALIALSRHDKDVRSQINGKDIENLIKKAKSLLNEGWALLEELRNMYVKKLRGKLEALKKLIDDDGEIKGGEPIVPDREYVAPPSLGKTVKAPVPARPVKEVKNTLEKADEITIQNIELINVSKAEGVYTNWAGPWPLPFCVNYDNPSKGEHYASTYMMRNLDKIKIKGPGFETTSYADDLYSYFFPLRTGVNDYEIQFDLAGKTFTHTLRINGIPDEYHLSAIKEDLAKIDTLGTQIASAQDYSEAKEYWRALGQTYASLAYHYVYTGEPQKAYEVMNAGGGLPETEGRMGFFGGFHAWVPRYMAPFIGADEALGYLNNVLSVSSGYLDGYRAKAQIIMENKGDFQLASAAWDEYISAGGTDKMPESWK